MKRWVLRRSSTTSFFQPAGTAVGIRVSFYASSTIEEASSSKSNKSWLCPLNAVKARKRTQKTSEKPSYCQIFLKSRLKSPAHSWFCDFATVSSNSDNSINTMNESGGTTNYYWFGTEKITKFITIVAFCLLRLWYGALVPHKKTVSIENFTANDCYFSRKTLPTEWHREAAKWIRS